MESIIDRVINELVFRLTNSSRSARSGNAIPEQAQVPIEPPAAPQATPEPQGSTIPGAPVAPQAQPMSQAPAPPQAQPTPQAQSVPPSVPSQLAPPMNEPTPQPEPTAVIVDRELQRVVGEARHELDAATQIVAELRASADGFAERIAATGERLDNFDAWIAGAAERSAAAAAPAPVAYQSPPQPPVAAAVPPQPPVAAAPPQPPLQPQGPLSPQPPVVPQEPWGQVEERAPTEFVSPPASAPDPAFAAPVPPIYPGTDQFAAEAAVPQTRTIQLTVASLSNLTVVSVVEAALLRIPGVREVALRQLQGRKAILEVRLDEGTGLISGLRKSLPLAFDVTESSDHSLEISLSYVGAQPQATNGGGGAGPTLA